MGEKIPEKTITDPRFTGDYLSEVTGMRQFISFEPLSVAILKKILEELERIVLKNGVLVRMFEQRYPDVDISTLTPERFAQVQLINSLAQEANNRYQDFCANIVSLTDEERVEPFKVFKDYFLNDFLPRMTAAARPV